VSKNADLKKLPGQLVRLTVRDYQLLREGLAMADEWRGSKMADEISEFNEMANERWNALFKIRAALWPTAVFKPDPRTTRLEQVERVLLEAGFGTNAQINGVDLVDQLNLLWRAEE